MNVQCIIFAAVVAVVFLFAGYNLYNYFSNQSEIQAQKDLEAQRAATEREQRKAAEAKARREAKAERKRQQQKEERLAYERREAQAAKRLKKDKEREAKRQAAIALKTKQEEERLQARITLARTPKHIEGLPVETIEKFNSIASRYIRDNPDEFLNIKFSDKTLHPRRQGKRLLKEDTNALMLYAAISQDTDILRALIDIGIDINSTNKAGYTPLMFATAYNTPDVVRFLIKNGANTAAKAYIQDLNALHVAALFNPRPDVTDVLLDEGMDMEAKTENGHTPLLLAASDNQNLEVVERLAMNGFSKVVYDAKGRTAFNIAEARIHGDGDEYIKISDDVNSRISDALR